ncbi:hypothetical protein ACH5RR_018071 [Cinchona calisaya]|uniref:Transposase MuDR plant domain-containing protein n=1 Tax=Cinchona calisaya TaxID=153742 RepID=A0ABD2ZNA6_9GENT
MLDDLIVDLESNLGAYTRVDNLAQQPTEVEHAAPLATTTYKEKKVQRRRESTSTRTTSITTSNTDVEHSLEEDDIPEEFYSDGGSTNDDNNEWVGVGFKAERDMRKPQFQLGKKFESAKPFRLGTKNCAIVHGKPVKPNTNENERVRAKCKTPCKWFVYASVDKALGTKDLVVKTLNDEHTNCSHAWKNKNITAAWLANRYLDRVTANINIPIRAIRQIVDEDYKAEITRVVAYKAMALAVKKIMGSAAEQYKQIRRYCDAIKKIHPNSTMEVFFTPEPGYNPKLMRLYCCLQPLKQAFKDGCRPITTLDGCHLKGKALKDMLWKIARSTTMEKSNNAMDDLEKFDKDAYGWVKEAPHPSRWCKAFCNPHTILTFINSKVMHNKNPVVSNKVMNSRQQAAKPLRKQTKATRCKAQENGNSATKCTSRKCGS